MRPRTLWLREFIHRLSLTGTSGTQQDQTEGQTGPGAPCSPPDRFYTHPVIPWWRAEFKERTDNLTVQTRATKDGVAMIIGLTAVTVRNYVPVSGRRNLPNRS